MNKKTSKSEIGLNNQPKMQTDAASDFTQDEARELMARIASAFTTEQKSTAFEAMEGCPISFAKLRKLCEAILKDDESSLRGMPTTLRHLKLHRLPKIKTVEWLARHDIASDGDLIGKLWLPLVAPLAAYYLAREAA